MKYKAVLFDLDDTIIDSITARVITLKRVFRTAGITQRNPEQFLRDLQGSALSAALDKLTDEFGIVNDLFLEYRRTYWTKEQGILKLYPGVKRMLTELRRYELALGVVTSKAVKIEFEGDVIGAAQELEELGVADLFSVLIGFEDVSLHKPHPEGINLALSHLETPSNQAIMVGDSAGDIEAARAAGCISCWATWGLPAYERDSLLDNVNPDYVIDSPNALLELFA